MLWEPWGVTPTGTPATPRELGEADLTWAKGRSDYKAVSVIGDNHTHVETTFISI